jgi:hypothetical protein
MRLNSILAGGTTIIPETEASNTGFRWVVRVIELDRSGRRRVTVRRGEEVIATRADALDEAARQADLMARMLTAEPS